MTDERKEPGDLIDLLPVIAVIFAVIALIAYIGVEVGRALERCDRLSDLLAAYEQQFEKTAPTSVPQSGQQP